MSLISRAHAGAVVPLVGAGIIAATPWAVPPPAFQGVALTAGSAFVDNLKNIWDAVTFQGGDQAGFLDPLATTFTLDASHDIVYEGLTQQITDYPYAGFDDLQPFVQFLASPLGGFLMGMLGPMISPGIALMNGENPVTAFFEGATLNLEPYIELFTKLGLMNLNPGIEIGKLDFAFGGLFSPGAVQGTGAEVPIGGPFPPGDAAGGSILNSVGVDTTAPDPDDPDGPPIHFDYTGEPVGPFGGLAALWGAIAAVIGWPEAPEVPLVPDAPDPAALIG